MFHKNLLFKLFSFSVSIIPPTSPKLLIDFILNLQFPKSPVKHVGTDLLGFPMQSFSEKAQSPAVLVHLQTPSMRQLTPHRQNVTDGEQERLDKCVLFSSPGYFLIISQCPSEQCIRYLISFNKFLCFDGNVRVGFSDLPEGTMDSFSTEGLVLRASIQITLSHNSSSHLSTSE